MLTFIMYFNVHLLPHETYWLLEKTSASTQFENMIWVIELWLIIFNAT